VTLNPDLAAVNARIKASAPRPRPGFADAVRPPAPPSTPLGGTIYNGYSKVTAQVAPGTDSTVTVSFDISVPSITSSTFDSYRTQLDQVLSLGTEQGIAQAAGIGPQPPPAPASRMAGYALHLFSNVVFGGEVVSDQGRAFTPQNCTSSACRQMLAVTRLLDVTQLSFSGTLTASSASPATEEVAAYVPTTAIAFSDGLTISFAGYSDNVLVSDGDLTQLDVPADFWSELADGDDPAT
jgi:hypothetical protein